MGSAIFPLLVEKHVTNEAFIRALVYRMRIEIYRRNETGPETKNAVFFFATMRTREKKHQRRH